MIRSASQARGRSAAAVVEFATAVPVFMLVLVGLVDLGRVVLLRMKLEIDIAAVCNFAAINAGSVNSQNGAGLATSIAAVMGSNLGATLNSGSVIINHGPTETIVDGSATSSGTASYADSCYCPTGTTAPWTWGSAATCGSTCAPGAAAGRFVMVMETQTFSPIFTTYAMVQNNQVSASAIVQVQ